METRSPSSVDARSESAPGRERFRWLGRAALVATAAAVVGLLTWQGITAHGNPDPTHPGTSRSVAALDIAVLVFREGLECILVLAAVTAGMTGAERTHRRPVVAGAGVGFAATLLTWWMVVGIVNDLSASVSALALQAATGLLAIVVLLVVMNWFFHKVYWGGWISLHQRRRKRLMASPADGSAGQLRLWAGLGLLGFTALYREGFEVVLFLQSYRLKFGGPTVFWGALVGVVFTGAVAVLTFAAHRRLPYRRMLVLTGILLGVVLLVMVGEEAQEMQLAHWLPSTPVPALQGWMPDWLGLWFSIFPNVQTLLAQLFAGVAVLGSYLLVKRSAAGPRGFGRAG